jgi:hypothetical protein
MSFTVGQLAKLTGLTVRALHHYHAIGLLEPSQRSDSGYRLYTQADIVRLYRIQALQRAQSLAQRSRSGARRGRCAAAGHDRAAARRAGRSHRESDGAARTPDADS